MKIYGDQYLQIIQRYTKSHDINELITSLSNLLNDEGISGEELLMWYDNRSSQEAENEIKEAIMISYDEYEFFYNLIGKNKEKEKDRKRKGGILHNTKNDSDSKKIEGIFKKVDEYLGYENNNLLTFSYSEEEQVKDTITKIIPPECTAIRDFIYTVIYKIIECKIQRFGNVILIEGGDEKAELLKYVKKAMVCAGIKYYEFDRENYVCSEDIDVCFLDEDDIEYMQGLGFFRRRKAEEREKYKKHTVFIVPVNEEIKQSKVFMFDDICSKDIITIKVPEFGDKELKLLFKDFHVKGYRFDEETIQHVLDVVNEREVIINKYEVIKKILEACIKPIILKQFLDKSNIPCALIKVSKTDIEAIANTIIQCKPKRRKAYSVENIINELERKVVGQNNVIRIIAPYVAATILKRKKGHVLGVYFFCGPSGTGKTMMAKTIADVLFDGLYHKEDMNTYTESHTALRILGSPPSYVGYKDGTGFINFIKKHNEGVIVLDEIEKAHPLVIQQFMEFFDTGRVVDSTGEEFDISNFLFICTSNVKFGLENKIKIGFCRNEFENNKGISEISLRKKLTDFFPAEFVGRLTLVVQFNMLERESIRIIARQCIEEVVNEMGYKCPNEFLDEMVEEAIQHYVENEGVRPVKAFITNVLRIRIAQLCQNGERKIFNRCNNYLEPLEVPNV